MTPDSISTSASTVGLPRESRISLATTSTIELTHVRDQVVVAERGAALTHEDVVLSARLARLLHHVLHFGWRQKLALLDIDRPSRSGDDVDEIGLAAEKRRRLQHVDRRRDFR